MSDLTWLICYVVGCLATSSIWWGYIYYISKKLDHSQELLLENHKREQELMHALMMTTGGLW